MNHTSIVHSISLQVNESNYLAYTGIPFILGETNSLYNEGAPGLSNSFGAALWGLDFNLWCASVGIRRVHTHQGTDYRYASWQPIPTNKTTIGTKPPYYGNIAVAAMLGNLTAGAVQIANLPLQSEFESAYVAYVDEKLARIAVINMRAYNYTVNGTSSVVNQVKRPSQEYSFDLPEACEIEVKRLYANGSDAISGITWDGWSYNWELDSGRPVRLHNMTVAEKLRAEGRTVSLTVEDSTAVILNFRRYVGPKHH
jgi:Glycosyl hydrolase family 79 C-terminal beta domain